MAVDKDLTVILTLKDRVPFTYRWMTYVNEIGFPFRILIADGGKDPTVAGVLSNRGKYPNVSYEYIRYPYDATYAVYHAKKVDALSRVDTPFVMFTDNDDFTIVEGLYQSLDFLKNTLDYYACKGRTFSFRLGPDPNALFGHTLNCDYQAATSIDQETAAERVTALFSNYATTYYDVHRTEVAMRLFQVLCKLDPKDVTVAELLTSVMMVASGKVRTLPCLYLLRQHHSDTNCQREDMLSDRFDRVLWETWSHDFTEFVNSVGAIIADTDGIPGEDAIVHVKRGYRKYIAPIIIGCLSKDVGKAAFNGGQYGWLARELNRLLGLGGVYRKVTSILQRMYAPDPIGGDGELGRNAEFLRIKSFLIGRHGSRRVS